MSVVKRVFGIPDGQSGLPRATEIIQDLFIDGIGVTLKAFYEAIGATLVDESDYGATPIDTSNLRYCLVFQLGMWYIHYCLNLNGTGSSSDIRFCGSSSSANNQLYANACTLMYSKNNMYDSVTNQHTFSSNNNYVANTYRSITSPMLTESVTMVSYLVKSEKSILLFFDIMNNTKGTTFCWATGYDLQGTYTTTNETSKGALVEWLNFSFSGSARHYRAFDCHKNEEASLGNAVTKLSGRVLLPVSNYNVTEGTLVCPNFYDNGACGGLDAQFSVPALTLGAFGAGDGKRYAVFISVGPGRLSTSNVTTIACILEKADYDELTRLFDGGS